MNIEYINKNIEDSNVYNTRKSEINSIFEDYAFELEIGCDIIIEFSKVLGTFGKTHLHIKIINAIKDSIDSGLLNEALQKINSVYKNSYIIELEINIYRCENFNFDRKVEYLTITLKSCTVEFCILSNVSNLIILNTDITNLHIYQTNQTKVNSDLNISNIKYFSIQKIDRIEISHVKFNLLNFESYEDDKIIFKNCDISILDKNEWLNLKNENSDKYWEHIHSINELKTYKVDDDLLYNLKINLDLTSFVLNTPKKILIDIKWLLLRIHNGYKNIVLPLGLFMIVSFFGLLFTGFVEKGASGIFFNPLKFFPEFIFKDFQMFSSEYEFSKLKLLTIPFHFIAAYLFFVFQKD